MQKANTMFLAYIALAAVNAAGILEQSETVKTVPADTHTTKTARNYRHNSAMTDQSYSQVAQLSRQYNNKYE